MKRSKIGMPESYVLEENLKPIPKSYELMNSFHWSVEPASRMLDQRDRQTIPGVKSNDETAHALFGGP
jgi:hypothetical protein